MADYEAELPQFRRFQRSPNTLINRVLSGQIIEQHAIQDAIIQDPCGCHYQLRDGERVVHLSACPGHSMYYIQEEP